MDIKYSDQADKEDVADWLMKNVPHKHISKSGRRGFNELHREVFIMYPANRVWIRDEKYATMFALKWS
jgi:hypothetical protein